MAKKSTKNIVILVIVLGVIFWLWKGKQAVKEHGGASLHSTQPAGKEHGGK